MKDFFSLFVDGLRKPFQTGDELASNQGDAVASYALLFSLIAMVRHD